MGRIIKGSVWKTCGHYAFSQQLLAYVAAETEQGRTWQAYVCFVSGEDKVLDEQFCCNHGAKLSRTEAAGFFPHLDIQKYKTA